MVNLVRKAIESMYAGVCTVYEYQSTKDPVTKISEQQEVAVLTDQPCRLSFKTITGTSSADGAAAVAQEVKLFIAPELTIKPGSKITVTQNNVTADYESSGKPAVYTHHQEIILELFKGWA
ncbi:hypothetical protein [Sporomusa acidovorans]|uniref:Phage protein n=1 Tax=Sporomusa acidovorans (strain ATCC 49682 / DSM 3132 / Mol) TaxID=1123286 RepID=A0ABZ3J7C3_SPOA4|nr:hypothetical protein [Sporomusa acidovorans]OZC23809.1 hypothetical protein SPACI_04340 [Sporomusa acidovorans DSM 3132]SDF61830.1 hypothetical protein SAMN04488499_106314 [Sporomusa acidovorans]